MRNSKWSGKDPMRLCLVVLFMVGWGFDPPAAFGQEEEGIGSRGLIDAAGRGGGEESASELGADEPAAEGAGGVETGLIETEDEPSLIEQCRAEASRGSALVPPPSPRYPTVNWHGYFRFRCDLFTEVDLGTYYSTSQTQYTATSNFLPPLVENYTNSSGNATFADRLAGRKEQTIGTGNMRLRLSPEIEISRSIRIGTTVDLLDNLVLGSTPEYLGNAVDASSGVGKTGYYGGYPGPAVPLDTFTSTQTPPSAGVNSLQDSIVVKEAWAEWGLVSGADARRETFSIGVLKLGRYAFDWGLGILSDRGDYDRDDSGLTPLQRFAALDADWGNYLDRISWRYFFPGFTALIGYGWLSSGPTSRVATTGWKQPYDLEQEDDLYQLEVAVYSFPESRNGYDAHRKRLFLGKPVFDWGVYVTYRKQSMATQFAKDVKPKVRFDYVADFGNLELVARDAWVVTPDLWLRLDWRPDPATRWYAGLEAAVGVGRIGNPTGAANASEIDLLQWGFALETNLTLGAISFGVDAGAASADNAELMEVVIKGAKPWGRDTSLTSFAFNPNYFVDMLLFREVVGTVTNAGYVRPHFDFDMIPTDENAFGGLVSVVYGFALEPEAFPGNSTNLGLEFNLQAFYEETNRLFASCGLGVLFPMAGLDRPADFLIPSPGKESAWAWTLQGNFAWVF